MFDARKEFGRIEGEKNLSDREKQKEIRKYQMEYNSNVRSMLVQLSKLNKNLMAVGNKFEKSGNEIFAGRYKQSNGIEVQCIVISRRDSPSNKIVIEAGVHNIFFNCSNPKSKPIGNSAEKCSKLLFHSLINFDLRDLYGSAESRHHIERISNIEVPGRGSWLGSMFS